MAVLSVSDYSGSGLNLLAVHASGPFLPTETCDLSYAFRPAGRPYNVRENDWLIGISRGREPVAKGHLLGH